MNHLFEQAVYPAKVLMTSHVSIDEMTNFDWFLFLGCIESVLGRHPYFLRIGVLYEKIVISFTTYLS